MTEDKKDALFSSFGKSSDAAQTHDTLENSRSLLRKSRTGAHLLKISDSYGLKPDTTPSPEQNGFLFIDGNSLPASEPARQVIDLAAHLRDAEQNILGYRWDRTDLTPEELEAQNHAKNLDIIVDLCRIGEELENDAPEVKNELFVMGYKHIYEAFKEKSGNDALIKAYEKMVEVIKK